jgi:hypothetical protein
LVREKYGVLEYFPNIRKKYFSQLLNVCNVSNVRQIETHTPEPRPFYIETAIAKSKKHKSSGSDQILVQLIQDDGEICSEIHKLINYVWNKDKLPQQWKESNGVHDGQWD